MMATGDRKDTGCGCVIKMLLTYTEQTDKEMGRETASCYVRPCLELGPGLGSGVRGIAVSGIPELREPRTWLQSSAVLIPYRA